jgi:two-component system NtrC family sensor kinase
MQPSQPEETAPSYQRAFERERAARKRAEELLESKSRELFDANRRLDRNYRKLEVAHDELKMAQAQLVQSEKMASVGQLAAGIAHEINNPIAFIRSNLTTLAEYGRSVKAVIELYEQAALQVVNRQQDRAEAILRQLAELRAKMDFDIVLEDCEGVISESLEGAERVTEIVGNLRNFSRLDENEIKEADINEGIHSTLKIAWNELKYRCNVQTDFGELPEIMCCPGQLNQVFLNMLVNSVQAIEESGEIRIATRTENDRIVIEISDTGCGIPEESLGEIFNPFFTTKEVGKGTGLGLSISYAIIEKHNGHIEVRSEVGKGTTFMIFLPIAGMRDQVA